ncbi:MAG: hypothetical protein L0H26_07385 [Microlunatus sp.]|nr:hypothetical protein [Microlunatus sp.]
MSLNGVDRHTCEGAGLSFQSLRDITRTQAAIHAALGAGSVLGDVAERVAASITGSTRISGTGRDLRAPAPPGWVRPDPVGLAAPGPVLTRYDDAATEWKLLDQGRYYAWRSGSMLLGEVKARQLDRHGDLDTQMVDTRGGGPATAFFPFVDFYVFVLFDLDGDVVMARRLDLEQTVELARRDVGRGGCWNYKVAIGTWLDLGTDLTVAARVALRNLSPIPESKLRI